MTECPPNGLTYTREVITKEIEEELIKNINNSTWDTTYERKIQQYGFKYEFNVRSIDKTISIPQWLIGIRDEFHEDANQIIINHYTPGQGIAPHIDNFKFGDKIVIISLGSGCEMEFNGTKHHKQYLEQRSCLTLEGYARWKITHQIKKRKSDIVDNKRKVRDERFSITFRIFN